MTITKDRILAAIAAVQPVAVEVPELGGTVYVRPLTLAGMSRFHAAVVQDATRGPAILIADCLCDASGTRLFTAADENHLADLPSRIAQRLVDAITSASGMDTAAAEGAAGNLPATR